MQMSRNLSFVSLLTYVVFVICLMVSVYMCVCVRERTVEVSSAALANFENHGHPRNGVACFTDKKRISIT